ncbi:hypothetical protein [Marinobacter sp. P4B1]|uniref:hypothetical protein n=1 Tax=Marinobacter sp. P4B1 TaxID=1119533 RepID=UPI00071CA273|nr:hypothetical protein [Marinobacter sp. P4B1]KRW83713.1 hypothetical protein AQ621_16825 [Marinobacter sp. P4B1]
MNELREFFPKNIVASLLAKYHLPRYQLLVRNDDPDQSRIFLYRKLEDSLLMMAQELLGDADISEACLAEIIKDIEPDLFSFGSLTVKESISQYNFLPKGFAEAKVSDEAGNPIGRTLVSYYDGVLCRFLARSSREFSLLVNAVVSGGSIDDLIKQRQQGAPRESANIISVQMPSGQQVIAKHAGSELIRPMSMAGTDGLVKAICHPESHAPVTSNWAQENFLQLGLLRNWDEEPPGFIFCLLGSEFSVSGASVGAFAHDLYLQKPSLPKVLKFWTDFSVEVSEKKEGHPAIAAAVGQLLLNPDYDPLLISGYSIPEWFAKKVELLSRRYSDRNEKAIHHAVHATENHYPELKVMRASSVAWVWDQYIRGTENLEADTSNDPKYRIDIRQRDPAFLCYTVFRPAIANRIFTDFWSGSSYLTIPTVEGEIEVSTKAFYLMVGSVVKDIIESSTGEKAVLIEEACFHIQQVLRAVRASWSLTEAALNPELGPQLMTSKDIEYCHHNNISLTRRIPVK